jgi:hypothetical protein
MRLSSTETSRRARSRSNSSAGAPGTGSALLLVLSVTLGGDVRLTLLKVILVLTAVGEALAFVSNAFRPRRFAERNGRPFQPAFHGVMQDFGFYNLAFAALLAMAALDPRSHSGLLGVITASYFVHALTHILRYFGFYFGGVIPFRLVHERSSFAMVSSWSSQYSAFSCSSHPRLECVETFEGQALGK